MHNQGIAKGDVDYREKVREGHLSDMTKMRTCVVMKFRKESEHYGRKKNSIVERERW